MNGLEAYAQGRNIYLDPATYQPRMNWSFCHELAHILLGHTEEQVKVRQMEVEADELAVELMLPAGEFRAKMAMMTFDELAQYNSHASWEVVARRWIQFSPAVLTIFDDEKVTRRMAPEGFIYPPHPTKPELDLVHRCYQAKRQLSSEIEGLTLQAYYIDENRGILRVILFTEFPESSA